MKQEKEKLSNLFEQMQEQLKTFFDERFMEISDEKLEELLKIRKERETKAMLNHN